MTLDFTIKGECHVLQEDHIRDIISSWPEDFKGNDSVLTPCSSNLFKVGRGGLLNKSLKEIFHLTVAKSLFVSNCSRPDILPTVSVLCSRVKNPNKDDWAKARRLVHYLRKTLNLHLVLRYDGARIARWHVDASFAAHEDFWSHSGGVLFMSPDDECMASGSTK